MLKTKILKDITIKTTTTSFKRAFNAVRDILTPKEIEQYDVGIEIKYSGTIGTIIMEHPTNGMLVSANFEGERSDEILETLFYMGDFIEKIKPFRRKEPLSIHIEGHEIIFDVDNEEIYRNDTDNERIVVPYESEVHTCNRLDFIEVLSVGHSITKTTFNESTMAIQLVVNKDKLHVKATNLAQMMFSELKLEEGARTPYGISLSAKLISKVRNTLERSKSDILNFYRQDDYLVFYSDNIMVAFKDEPTIQHVNANIVLQSLKWRKENYHINTNLNYETIQEQYQSLLVAEEEKDVDRIAETQIVFLYKNKEKIIFSMFPEEHHVYFVSTRDMNALFKRLPKQCNVRMNAQAMLVSNNNERRKMSVLIPIQEQKEGG